MKDLELVAGDRASIKRYRTGRSDKPALECRIGGRDNAEVSVLGYQMVDSKINRVLVGQLDHDVLGRITTHRRTGDPQTILRATPAIPWTEREELCRFPIKAINYALDLAQIVIQEHLSTSNEPEELRGRPLYITRTSDVEWREPKFLFNGDSHLEVTVNEMVRVPSGPDAQSPTDSWEIEMRLSGDNRESWLKATMMVVRPPDLLPPTRGTMKYNQASARS